MEGVEVELVAPALLVPRTTVRIEAEEKRKNTISTFDNGRGCSDTTPSGSLGIWMILLLREYLVLIDLYDMLGV